MLFFLSQNKRKYIAYAFTNMRNINKNSYAIAHFMRRKFIYRYQNIHETHRTEQRSRERKKRNDTTKKPNNKANLSNEITKTTARWVWAVSMFTFWLYRIVVAVVVAAAAVEIAHKWILLFSSRISNAIKILCFACIVRHSVECVWMRSRAYIALSCSKTYTTKQRLL